MSRPFVIQTLPAIRLRCTECGDCWIWQGSTDGHGRPQVRHDGRVWYVRRLVRQLKDGKPVPDGLIVPNRCGDKLCVSPVCSLIGTQSQKTRMAAERGAYGRPDTTRRMAATKRAKSRFTDELIAQIRIAEGPSRRIADETGVSVSHVKAIRRGVARRDYSSPFAGLGA